MGPPCKPLDPALLRHSWLPPVELEQWSKQALSIKLIVGRAFSRQADIFLSDAAIMHLDDAVEKVDRPRIVRDDADGHPFGVCQFAEQLHHLPAAQTVE